MSNSITFKLTNNNDDGTCSPASIENKLQTAINIMVAILNYCENNNNNNNNTQNQLFRDYYQTTTDREGDHQGERDEKRTSEASSK